MRTLGILVFCTFLLVAMVAHSKEITYRGGLLVFDVPDGWVEEEAPDGGGMFYAKEPNSGTLRLNVLTFKRKADSKAKTPAEILGSLKSLDDGKVRELANGNALGEEVQRATEKGEQITLYWLYVASQTPAHRFRIACFSYTVLSSQVATPRVEKDLAFLRKSIERTQFSPQLGE